MATVAVVFNPRSGRGKATRIARAAAARLGADGHHVRSLELLPTFDAARLEQALAGVDAAVIAGGDGTVHHALGAVVRSGAAVYHAPTGNENLFARQFKMGADPAAISAALARGGVETVDLGACADNSFAVMCSVGIDAAIVHRLARTRSGTVSHLSYLVPALAEFARFVQPALRVIVDGSVVVDGGKGILVVANSRQYALRIDPARRASMTDGLLDAVFLPCSGRISAVGWGLQARIGRHLRSGRAVYATGADVVIERLDGPIVHQFDGEAPAPASPPADAARLELGVRPRALRVLVP